MYNTVLKKAVKSRTWTKNLPKVAQKSLKSLPKVSQKSLKSRSKVSQKSLKSLWKAYNSSAVLWQCSEDAVLLCVPERAPFWAGCFPFSKGITFD